MNATFSTHVLDTARGVPAEGIGVSLRRIDDPAHTTVGTSTTDADGRTGAGFAAVAAGRYELVFDVEEYFERCAVKAFYDVITIRFRVADDGGRYHVPLLLSPWGYSTYRGS